MTKNEYGVLVEWSFYRENMSRSNWWKRCDGKTCFVF